MINHNERPSRHEQYLIDRLERLEDDFKNYGLDKDFYEGEKESLTKALHNLQGYENKAIEPTENKA